MYTGTILIAVIFGAVGFILGALVYMLVAGRDKSSEQPPAPPAARPGAALLFRDPATGKLLVEMDGRVVAGSMSLNVEQRGKLEKLYLDLSEWLGISPVPAASQPVHAVQRPAEQPPAIPPGPALVTPPPAAPPRSSSLSARMSSSKEPVPPGTPPGVEPIPATPFQPVKPNPDAAKPAPTIVMQIDEILQEMAAKSPMGNRGIRITEEPREGVIVWIGTSRYQGIDAVPDPEIRALIRAAVAEWERRSESKA